MQIMVWGLTEAGEVIGKTIREKDWEDHEKNGFKKNPIHLPNSVERLSKIIVNEKKQKLNHVSNIKKKLEKAEDIDSDNYKKIAKSKELLENEIAEKEAAPHLTEKELGDYGRFFDDAVEVENFLLNLGSERSKKKVQAFLRSKGVEFDSSLSLKPLKIFAKEALHGN